jgi:hypothetical protein
MASRFLTLVIVASLAFVILIALIMGVRMRPAGGFTPPEVDLVVVNGKVYPPGGRGGFAEAVAVQSGRILATGSSDEIRRFAGPQATVIDARGGSVLPGFNDSHLHFVSGGLGLEQADLLDAGTVQEIEQRIRSYAAAHADRPWVLGGGWHYTEFSGGLPTRQQLDRLVADRPALLDSYDGHTGWANSKALALAGITKATPDPAGGVIVKDPGTGEPTGALKETAQRLMSKVVPEPTREDRRRALESAIAEAHRFGVTSVQNAGISPEDLALYEELRGSGRLTVRVYSALSVSAPFTEADADRLEPIRAQYADDPVLKVGGAKLFVDGVIESHTAVMLEPYADAPGRGTPRLSAVDLDRIVALLDRRGWQVWMHAIGDGAVRMALDACERAAAVNTAPARGRRHRIEHIETLAPADLPRFGRLGVVASQQPFHGNPVTNAVWAAAIGPERASRGWILRSIMDAGGRLAFGSDWPVVTMDPRFGIHMAVNRTSPDGKPPGGWLPEQRLPLRAALDAYTAGPAYASFEEQHKGVIAPGMFADLVILSRDIFALPPERLLDAVVDVTIFDGKVVYRRSGDPAAR